MMGLSSRCAAFVLAAALALAAPVSARVPPARVRGRVTDPDGLPLPGVVVTLSATRNPSVASAQAVTDGQGEFSIDAPAGDYTLAADLSGFQRADQEVHVGATGLADIELRLRLGSFEEQVTVKADAPHAVLGETQPDAPVTATREVVDNGMLPNSTYDDVLPLMPNVVRGPDGLISVGGASGSQSGLVVNGFNLADPISGEASLQLPIEAVDSVEVFAGSYPAEAGRATGGVTSVHTRAGGDQWHASANSFFPRFRFENGQPAGVAHWEPNVGVSGPLSDRLTFAQGISYRFNRDLFDTLAGSQDSISRTLMSWSQFDWRATDSQRLSASVSLDPQSVDHAHVTAFTAVGSTPMYDRGGWTVGLADRLTLGGNSVLELRGVSVHSRMQLEPNGTGTYEMAHDTISGDYFDARDMRSTRTEGAWAWSWTAPHGHQVKIGGNLARESIAGSESAGTVDMLDSSLRLRRRVTFLPADVPIDAAATHAGFFVQDRWTASPHLTIDAGARVDDSTSARPVVSPRFSWTLKLPWGDSTLGGSAGYFADKIPLQAYAFAEGQPRLVEAWDASGVKTSSLLFTNALGDFRAVPTATRWDLEFAHRFADGWQWRVRYQERHGHDELVVDPLSASATSATLSLGATGTSMARSLEATAAYRAPGGGQEWYVSYVRAEARGPANTLAAIQGPFRDPFVQPDQNAPLLSDVPNRVVAWGLIHLPRRITVAPFLETRSGFPYTPIDDTWSNAAPVNSARLPWFASLDLSILKVFTVSPHLPDVRLGLKLYNIASLHTERDVQRDLSRPDFGQTYNAIPRDFTMVFELLWGRR